MNKDETKEIVNKNVDKEIINKDCSEMVSCEVCEAKFANEKDYIVHKETHIISSTYLCEICALEFTSETDVEKHVERTHTPDRIDEETSDIPIECTKCSVFVKTQKDLETHHQLEHMTLKINVEASLDKFEVECNQCKNKCKLNIQLKAHTRKVHVQDPKYKCKECKFTSNFAADVWEHVAFEHPNHSHQFPSKENENVVLKLVAEQNTEIVEEMSEMKKESQEAFEQIKKVLKAN